MKKKNDNRKNIHVPFRLYLFGNIFLNIFLRRMIRRSLFIMYIVHLYFPSSSIILTTNRQKNSFDAVEIIWDKIRCAHATSLVIASLGWGLRQARTSHAVMTSVDTMTAERGILAPTGIPKIRRP